MIPALEKQKKKVYDTLPQVWATLRHPVKKRRRKGVSDGGKEGKSSALPSGDSQFKATSESLSRTSVNLQLLCPLERFFLGLIKGS